MLNELPIFTTIIGLAGVFGGLLGFFSKGRAQAVIDLLSKENDVLKDSIGRLEKSVAALTAERDSLLTQNQTLKELSQGSPQLETLTKKISQLVDSNTKVLRHLAKGAK